MQIAQRKIGPGNPCFFVAEVSGNHLQSFSRAEAIIRAAHDAGADAVKLQTYTADTITLNSDKPYFFVGGKDQPDVWKRENLYALYEKAHTPWEWQPRLKKIAEDLGMILFSTPFDESAVDFLMDIGVPAFKIASYEAVHIPLIEKIAATGKPVIMSVGFAILPEVTYAVEALKKNGAKDIAMLHCVTAYSDTPLLEEMNLATIKDLQRRFDVIAGFSDNNTGVAAPVIAALRAGASIIEKHLIISRADGGPDARFSLEPDEFKQMVSLVRKGERGEKDAVLRQVATEEEISSATGHPQYGPASERERENVFFRPSVWVKKDMRKGDAFSEGNIRVARPSHGLPPRFFREVLGRRASQDIESATPLSWDLVEGEISSTPEH